MCDWVAVTGQAAVPDKDKPVEIEFSYSAAVAKPPQTTPAGNFPYTGVVHIPLPSCPSGKQRVYAIAIEHDTNLANLTNCVMTAGTGIEWNGPLANYNYNAFGTNVYTPNKYGWTVSLEISFQQLDSTVTIKDCRLEFI
jgi:hypothetical protein